MSGEEATAKSSSVMDKVDLPESSMEQILSAFRSMSAKAPKKAKDPGDHKFWSKQPVPQFEEGEIVGENGPIEPEKTVAEVRQTPYGMPAGFEWVTIDVTDPAQLATVYRLLNENYVEDDDNMFRFDYSVAFLQWALTPPGYLADWHVGVKNSKNGELVGFITGVPAELSIHGVNRHLAEINFLCVHKSLRDKRLAPVLIKEITRRVNLTDKWQAVYTAGVVLPRPVTRCRYWHRSLNPKKLIEVRFSRLAPRMTMARTVKLYKLPDTASAPLRYMTAADVPSVTRLLNHYLETTTKIRPVFSDADVAHWLLPRAGVIDTFVVANAAGEVTDMCSFYHLPSTIIGNDKHSILNAAYSYFNVATTVTLESLMRDALVLARNIGSDVFNALDLMENKKILEPLKFGIGDGHLQYYLYNWKCPEITPEELGVVLL